MNPQKPSDMNYSIKQPEKPITKEILAESIVRIGSAFNALKSSGLNEAAVIVLIHDATKLSKRDIKDVLDALSRLKGWYCR